MPPLMSTSTTALLATPARRVRRVVERVELLLRGDDEPYEEGRLDVVDAHPLDVDDTAELLRPVGSEPAADRARRQAMAYLERRRRKLALELDESH